MSLASCLILSAFLFATGVFGVLTRRNVIHALLCIELMLNAGILNFVAFARYGCAARDPADGTVFTLFIIALTSCEMAVGLALAVAMYRRRDRLDLADLKELHG